MRSFAAGEVIASKHPGFAVGDKVMGMLGWQEYALAEPGAITRKVLENDLPLSLSLGLLGLNGVTAYFGLLEVGRPRPGDTVVVSTAAGAVGSAVGQIAKIAGCRTVGITGGEARTRLCVDAFGYDAAVDYKAQNFEAALADACRGGVNVYFDNTAGRISDAVLRSLAPGARLVICGTASVASWDRGRSDRGSSGICWSSGRRCQAFWCSTISIATRRRLPASRNGCARACSITAKIFRTASSIVQAPSQRFIAATISARA